MSIGSSLSSCGWSLDTAGTTYTLQNDISTGSDYYGACLSIGGDDIILNCDGKTITGPSGGVLNSGSNGIRSSGGFSNLTIANCEIKDFQYTGIYFLNPSSNVILSNVNLHNNKIYGAFLVGSNPIVVNSNFSNNADSGIFIMADYSEVIFVNNALEGNSLFGGRIYLADGGFVENNTFSNSTFYAFYISFSTNIAVRNNTFSDSGYTGAYLSGLSNSTITGNTATGNGTSSTGSSYAGIYLSGGSGNTLTNNYSCNLGYDFVCGADSVKSGSGNTADTVSCDNIGTVTSCT